MLRELSTGIVKQGIRALSAGWEPYSRLILSSDGRGWSLDWDIRELKQIVTTLGIQTCGRIWKNTSTCQAIYFAAAQTITDNDNWLALRHRIGISFPQGVPYDLKAGSDPVYSAIERHHEHIHRLTVSHGAMRTYVLETGIDPGKVFQIPLGINLSYFRFRDGELRRQQRSLLGIPENAFVIGSIQKDGTGWGAGMEPKLVKGPDVLVDTLVRLKPSIPGLFVLLVGPARGFVRSGLEKNGIPYLHLEQQPYKTIGELYQALDLYLVTARQEGGPKAVLESMASGVPLVTTRVGQATDLVRHGQNGWMVDIEDVNGLAQWTEYVHQSRGPDLDRVLQEARATALANSYSSQLPLWEQFMKGFVEWEPRSR